MAAIYLGVGEDSIIIESLLLTIKKRDAEIERIKERAFNNDVAASILRDFLVDKHAELTDELVDFTLTKVEKNGYDVNTIAGGGISALEYHRDTLDNKNLDAAIKKLNAELKASR